MPTDQRVTGRRLCLQNVPLDLTKNEILSKFFEDFEYLNDDSVFMDAKTQSKAKKTRLVFVAFSKHWHAKVACKLVNLLHFKKITADFATPLRNDIDWDREKLPTIYEKRTETEGGVPMTGKCAECGSPDAAFVCSICYTSYAFTFYCSKDHQKKDWNCHKRECKRLPILLEPTEVAEATKDKIKAMNPVRFAECFKEGESVVIMHVASDKVLYVRPARPDDNSFENLMKDLREFSKTAAKTSKKPEINSTILAPFEGGYQRAQVMDYETSPDSNDLLVFFIDIGVIKKVPASNLKDLNFKFRLRERQTFKVILESVINESNPHVKKHLETLCLDQVELKVESIRGEIDRFVVLRNGNSGDTVNEEVQKITTMIEPSMLDERIFFDKSKIAKLPTGSDIKIRVINVNFLGEGIVSVMNPEHYSTFWRLERDVNEYGNTQAPPESYKPQMDELCLVKDGERWERAIALNLLEEGYEMLFVDNFLVKNILKAHVKRIPAQLASNFYVQQCYISNLVKRNFPIALDMIKACSNVVADEVFFDEIRNMMSLTFEFLY